ncbi:Tyrosine-protein phosphatase non-receptor type 23 [Dinochytrium kinnereticum]|nr:Tyrosine-protein phosphatase non-receptor type 23 [Dinochytrium kinnereticum]
MIYYPPSLHRFYETESPQRIPFNAGPEAFTNLEAPKFIALPIKRNCLQAQNEGQPSVGDVMKLLTIATQRVMRKAAGVDPSMNNSNISLESTKSAASGPSAGPQPNELVDFEMLLSEHIALLVGRRNETKGSPRASSVSARLSAVDSKPPADGSWRQSRERVPGAPAFRTVSLFDAIQMGDMDLEQPRTTFRESEEAARSGEVQNVETDMARDEESAKSWNQLMHTTMSFLPTKYEWGSLNQLRVFAGAPEKSERGVEKLSYYFSILTSMEEKLHMDLNIIKIPFTWYEAFHTDKKVITTCIHYEKAAVLFNIAAIYSQLGSSQRLWNKDGKKLAASFFQKAAGVLTHLRDTLWHRFQIRLDHTSDLSEETLTAASHLLLAQAMECYYDKATEDRVKSAVTSMIAAQTSDYYEVALRSSRLNVALISRGRFPKEWTTLMNIKFNFFGSVAHFHAPLSLTAEQAVGERIARLSMARNLALKSFKISKDVGGAVQDLLNAYLSVVTSAHLLADAANFERYHHPSVDTKVLQPLKRPLEALVMPWPFEATVGDINRFPDMFSAVISVAFQSDAASLFSTHLKLIRAGSADLRSSLFTIERALQDLEPELVVSGTSEENDIMMRSKIVERANYVKDRLETLRKDEVVKKIEESIAALSQAMEQLDEITVRGRISDSSLVERSRHLRIEIVHLSEQLIVARMAKKTLTEQYSSEKSQFDPEEWTADKLEQLFPLTDSHATFEFEKKRNDELCALFGEMQSVKELIEGKIRELEELERRAGEDLNENALDRDTLKRMQNRRVELKVLETSISEIRAKKDNELMRFKQLKDSVHSGPASEYDEAMEIIQSFEKSVECLLRIRDNLKSDLEEIAKTREQSIHLLAACYLLQDNRDESSGDDSSSPPDLSERQNADPLSAQKTDPIVQQFLEIGQSENTAHPLTTPKADPIVQQFLETSRTESSKKDVQSHKSIIKRPSLSFSNETDSISQVDIDGYLKSIAGFQRDEIARLSIKYKILERETLNAADAEKAQRMETERIGNVAQRLFEDASRMSTADLISEAMLSPRVVMPVKPPPRVEEGRDRMEVLEALKRRQRDLLVRQGEEKAALAAKQVAEHAELMKQHQTLVQKNIPTRRPSSRPVRFMGLDEPSSESSVIERVAKQEAAAVSQNPFPEVGRTTAAQMSLPDVERTAPPTQSSGWNLSSDKIKKGLFKLVGMNQQQLSIQEPLKDHSATLTAEHPFGHNVSRKTSYAANIELLESKTPNPPSRQHPRYAPERNISTSSAYDTYFDAAEQLEPKPTIDLKKDASVQANLRDVTAKRISEVSFEISDDSFNVSPLSSRESQMDREIVEAVGEFGQRVAQGMAGFAGHRGEGFVGLVQQGVEGFAQQFQQGAGGFAQQLQQGAGAFVQQVQQGALGHQQAFGLISGQHQQKGGSFIVQQQKPSLVATTQHQQQGGGMFLQTAYQTLPQSSFTFQQQPQETIKPSQIKREKSRFAVKAQAPEAFLFDDQQIQAPAILNLNDWQVNFMYPSPAEFSPNPFGDGAQYTSEDVAFKPKQQGLSTWVEEQRRLSETRATAKPRKASMKKTTTGSIPFTASPVEELSAADKVEARKFPPSPQRQTSNLSNMSGGMVSATSPKRKPVDTSFLNSSFKFVESAQTADDRVAVNGAGGTAGKKSKGAKDVRQDSGIGNCGNESGEEGRGLRRMSGAESSLFFQATEHPMQPTTVRETMARMKMDNDALVKQLGSLHSPVSGGSSNNTYVSSSRKS